MATPHRCAPGRPHAPTALHAALCFALCATATLLPAPASGQPRPGSAQVSQGTQGDEIAHTVQDGDTLEGLARTYLAGGHQWPLLQARNKVRDPRRLQPGSVVWIPVRLQPTESATVAFVQGSATASQGGTTAPLAQGTRLDEGTQLQVDRDSFVAVRLADGTLVRVQAQTDLQLRQLRRRGRAGSLQSVLEMQRGAIESSVPPATGGPGRHFELRPPAAVTSVRGTRFGVVLDEAGQTAASVLDGTVAVQSRREGTATAAAPAGALLSPGQGVAVSPGGTLGAPRALLAPPDTSGVPATLSDASLLAIDLPDQPGAARYVAQVALDADATQVLRQGSFANGQLRWKAVDDGPYYLSVRAVDDAGIPGLPTVRPFIVKARPVAPLYLHPAPGAVLARGAGELRCTEVAGVRWYRIQIASDQQFTAPVQDAQQLSECRLPLAALPNGSYFWRAASVRSMPGGQPAQGPYGAPQSFTVADRPAVLSSQSLDVQDGDPTVRLQWSGQAGQRFRLQLATAADPQFERIVLDTELDGPRWTSGDLKAGEYLLRIQVLDPSGLQSDFSAPRQIRVGTGIRTGTGLPVSTTSGNPLERP